MKVGHPPVTSNRRLSPISLQEKVTMVLLQMWNPGNVTMVSAKFHTSRHSRWYFLSLNKIYQKHELWHLAKGFQRFISANRSFPISSRWLGAGKPALDIRKPMSQVSQPQEMGGIMVMVPFWWWYHTDLLFVYSVCVCVYNIIYIYIYVYITHRIHVCYIW